MFVALELAGSPLVVAVSIAAATYVSEDATTLAVAALSAQGRVNPALGAAACAVGIWSGDVGLYWLGRAARSVTLAARLLQRIANQSSITRAEQEFRQKGWAVLTLSRFVPGTRLASYVSAGVLRMPAAVFAAITGACAAVWVALIFAFSGLLAHVARERFADTALAILLALVLARACSTRMRPLIAKTRLFIGRYSRWEFWPAWLFYPPVALMCAWLTIRHRGVTATSSNPAIKTGGIVGESKFALLSMLMNTAPEATAEAALIEPGEPRQRARHLEAAISLLRLQFPVVLKPDVGQRGAGFRVVRSITEASDYLARVPAALVLQRYVPYENEAGIFWYRRPGESRGQIFAITRKEFPHVTGDGSSTLSDLVMRDERARLIASTYERRFASTWKEVVPLGQRVRLVEAGNHCQGCIFVDGGDLATESLRNRLDEILRPIEGFYIGRFDVRYSSDAELREGRAFSLIELNGAASEATNIYDPANSLLTAYRALYRQWKLVFEIGAENRAHGTAPTSPLELWSEWRRYQQLATAYPQAD